MVNCLEPHPTATLLATSGIDSDIKLWTPTADRPSQLSHESKQVREGTAHLSEEEGMAVGVLWSPLLSHRRLVQLCKSTVGIATATCIATCAATCTCIFSRSQSGVDGDVAAFS